MTPGARMAAAIGVLDAVLAGAPVERALTNWARGARYAGSGDRAAVRDMVFDAMRCRRSFGWLGGGSDQGADGRALMLGWLRAARTEPEGYFGTGPYAPPALSEEERAARHDLAAAPRAVALDLPDWLLPCVAASLGDDTDAVARRMKTRASVFLRVNTLRGDLAAAAAALRQEGIETSPHSMSPTALEVSHGARRVRASKAFEAGLVELQDVASQAVVDMVPLAPNARVLDYCAGGGGKSLAMAARTGGAVHAHDADPGRMRDLGPRAQRAGAHIVTLGADALASAAPFEVILCDVPCSGSGAWRRAPEGKWRLTQAGLDALVRTQAEILEHARHLLAPGGALAYATCSVLDTENAGQIQRFLQRNATMRLVKERRFSPLEGGDGFYCAHLTHVL